MTTNASNEAPAPSKPVKTISRISPSILERKVQKLTKPDLANNFDEKDSFSFLLEELDSFIPLLRLLNLKKLN